MSDTKDTESSILKDSIESCKLCGSDKITDLGHAFTHIVGVEDYRKSIVGEKLDKTKSSISKESSETHVMCDLCLKDFIRVCTCDKVFKAEPKILTLLCSCPSDGFDSSTRLYFDIDHSVFLQLLSHWKDGYYIIEGCRGCRYTIKEIQTQFKIGLQAAVEACVYKRHDIDKEKSAMAYQSDALDDDFIQVYTNICNAMGFENLIGEGSDL